MSATVKYLLDEEQIPKSWYNIQADLPEPLPPTKATHLPGGASICTFSKSAGSMWQ